jgi:hypothetical protein
MAAAANSYTIRMTMRENARGVRNDADRAHYVNTCADWKITKDFDIFTRVAPRTPVTTGYIAQLVVKTTEVTRKTSSGDVILRTSDEIAAMTLNNTKYMTFSYIEIFEYDAVEWEADQFMNGPVVPFDADGPWCVDATNARENKYHTKGTINMLGTVIYIPASARFLPAGEGFVRPAPNNATNDNPANGLLWRHHDPAVWSRMLALSGSDPYYHRVAVRWEYPVGPCASVTTLTQTCDGGVGFISPIISAANCPGAVSARGRGRGRGRGGARRRMTRRRYRTTS